VSIDETDSFVAYQEARREGLTVEALSRQEDLQAKRAKLRAASLESRLVTGTNDKVNGK